MLLKKLSVVLLGLLLPATLFARTVYLDELDLKYVLQDWGAAVANKSVLRTPLRVAGVEYKRGIGAHAISRMLLDLGGKAKSLKGLVGADDYNLFTCNMEFQILADRQVVWSSGVIRRGMPAVPFEVDLRGVQKVALLVLEAGDGIMYDHADWLEARIETSGRVLPEPILPAPRYTEKYILTPEAPPTPRINSAKVFGVRPGSPFLYTVAATGERPMRFEAVNLPEGLALDSETGFITGSLSERGTFNVILKARNALGEDTRTLRIESGDRLCLTPPMGWNSWNCWAFDINDQRVRDAAGYMARELINHGWTYINIDDGWQAARRGADSVLLGNDRFPDFKSLSDYVHNLGLKFGIYSSPGPYTCGRYVGSYRNEQVDAKTWADWGIDYLKYDYCLYTLVEPSSEEAAIQRPYLVMRDALEQTDRDILYCVGYGAPNVWKWGAEAGGQHWRTTRDITDEWNVMTAIGLFQDVCAGATRPGRYNDPDMLVVGKLGWGERHHDSYLTPDEQYFHISLWSLLSAPLLLGCDMNDMDDFTMNLVTNDEVLAVDQDPLAMPANKIVTENGQIWYKYLEDGAVAVGFFHADPYFIHWDKSDDIQSRKYAFSLDFASIGLNGKYTVRDLWRQQDEQRAATGFKTEVPYHGVKFVKLTPER